MVGALLALSPWGALACLVALVPLLGLGLVARRSARAARSLGLPRASPWPTVLGGVVTALGLALIGLAAAQPAIETTRHRQIRTESEVVFVVDVSRSMLAAAGRGAPTRLDRARALVRQLRASVDDVPAGIAGITDRVLPYLFPTVDPGSFDQTLRRSVLPEAPPPAEDNTVATAYGDLAQLASSGYYRAATRNRACVLVTDGEARTGSDAEAPDTGGLSGGLPSLEERLQTQAGAADGVVTFGPDGGPADASALAGESGCSLVVVRVGGVGDRIYLPGGRVEGQYRPLDTAADAVRSLADATGGQAFGESEVGGAAEALRSLVAAGPITEVGTGRTLVRLAPWIALAGTLLIAVLVVVRVLRREYVRQQLFE